MKKPAFPIKEGNYSCYGITDRTYIATNVFNSIVTKFSALNSIPFGDEASLDNEIERLVKVSYKVADEFLRQEDNGKTFDIYM